MENDCVFMALDRDIVRKMKALRSSWRVDPAWMFVGLSRGVDVLVRWSNGRAPNLGEIG